MPIASKLVYFQRRPAPAAPDDPGPEPPDPRRRPCRDPRRRSSSSSLSSSHQKPGQEHVPGHQRDAAAAKPPGPVGKAAERAAGGTATASSARLHHRGMSDHGRLPDAVQQARERLLQRLSSVDLSGRRQKTWPSQTFWAGAGAGLARPVPADACASASSDSVLGGGLTLTNRPGEPVAASRVGGGAIATEPVVPAIAIADECMPVTVLPNPVSALQEAEDGRVVADAASDCSICLEMCSGDELTQLRCGHVFHSACLQRWLRSRADCPYCRAAVRARS